MIRLAISVEGQTEEGFVNEVLANHLQPMGVFPFAIRIHRARSTSGGNVGGGNVSFEKFVSDMVGLSWNFNAVTSLSITTAFKTRVSGRLRSRRKISVGKSIEVTLA